MKLLLGYAGLCGMLLFGCMPVSSAGISLPQEYDRLLESYGKYKHYTVHTTHDIEKTLTEDRLNTVRGILRATEIELKAGDRLITHIESLRGIWGVRAGDPNGSHQFRLSVSFMPGIRAALDASSAFDQAYGAHVLLPIPKAHEGDDDPKYTEFTAGKDPDTWRQSVDSAPSLQVCLLPDGETGEFDVDFDRLVCHFKPSNSDIGSVRDQEHSHLAMLNRQFPFGQPLVLPCSNTPAHCQKFYDVRLKYCS